MKEIKLTQGMVTKVDDTDYGWLSEMGKWQFDRYAYCTRVVNGKRKSIRMHRLIMNPPEGMVVDHINGDRLDNRRENLRVTTQSVNARNIHNPRPKKIPAPQGITWDKLRGKWKAQGCIGYKKVWLGRYDTIEEASTAVDKFLRGVVR
jgi:hypothetical protein